MSPITFYVAARCEKAGRSVNQDSVLLCPDVSNLPDSAFTGNIDLGTPYQLSSAGALLVVADGMGGMSAGEKASELVIKGIQERFTNLPAEALTGTGAALQFLKEAIDYADRLIKQYAVEHPETRGLGSTLTLVWLLGDQAVCAWCGDSRIYRFNPANGLVRLSHDHSYVQDLVDHGKIDREDAFDHPDSNIITRSMGDSGEKVRPEMCVYQVYENDIFMLCSDGLCGLLPDPTLSEILRDNQSSVSDALKALWEEGEQAHWTDNSTILLCGIAEGGKKPSSIVDGYPEAMIVDSTNRRRGPARNNKVTTTFRPDVDAPQPAERAGTDAQPASTTVSHKGWWMTLTLLVVVIVTAAWIGMPYIFDRTETTAATVAEAPRGKSITYNGDFDDDAVTSSTTQPSKNPSATPTPTHDATPSPDASSSAPDVADTREQPTKNAAPQPKASPTVPAAFINRLHGLNQRKSHFKQILAQGSLSNKEVDEINGYVKQIVSAMNECNKRGYRLSAGDDAMLHELIQLAEDLNKFVKNSSASV